jgi:AcrR family transcriptional regulator
VSARITAAQDGAGDALAALTPRERLLAVAERLFAEHGWAGVSVRALTAAADVNLASLHYHFGSKESLLEEIFASRAAPIAAERLRRLDDCAEAAGRPPLLEQILDAFLRPALTLGMEARFGGPAFVKLRARLATEPEGIGRRILAAAFDQSSRRFLEALERALPEVPRRDLEWRFHFLLGAMVYTMADTGRIQALTDGACDPGRTEDALRTMIPFFAAGFRSAPVPTTARRKRRETTSHRARETSRT